MEKHFTEEEILAKFDKLVDKKKIVILEKALKLFVERRAGTRGYAIAHSMGYIYQDDGTYIK